MVVTQTDISNITISTTALRWAAYTALKKFPYTSQGFRRRSPFEILDDLFRGDLAKSALIENLASSGAVIHQEYDRIRTDNFQRPNLTGYDFIANQSRIEVNSSLFPVNYSRSQALYLDIKVTAGDNGVIHTYPPNLPFDVTVQLYFNFQSSFEDQGYSRQELEDISRELNSPDDALLDDIILKLNANNRYFNSLLAYGWATRNDIEHIRLANIHASTSQTWSFQNSSREYWKCKIRDTNPFRLLSLYI